MLHLFSPSSCFQFQAQKVNNKLTDNHLLRTIYLLRLRFVKLFFLHQTFCYASPSSCMRRWMAARASRKGRSR